MKTRSAIALACLLLLLLLLTGCDFEIGAPRENGNVGGHGIEPVVVTDANFDQLVLESSQPVMVDFWAQWCGPCMMLKPTVHELAADFEGRAVVAQLNVDDNPEIARRYDVSAIPTLLFFKNGELVERLEGLRGKSLLSSKLAGLVKETNVAGAE
jgi:thioredoxin 1